MLVPHQLNRLVPPLPHRSEASCRVWAFVLNGHFSGVAVPRCSPEDHEQMVVAPLCAARPKLAPSASFVPQARAIREAMLQVGGDFPSIPQAVARSPPTEDRESLFATGTGEYLAMTRQLLRSNSRTVASPSTTKMRRRNVGTTRRANSGLTTPLAHCCKKPWALHAQSYSHKGAQSVLLSCYRLRGAGSTLLTLSLRLEVPDRFPQGLSSIMGRPTSILLRNGHPISGQEALELLLRNAIVPSWRSKSTKLPFFDPTTDRGPRHLAIASHIPGGQEPGVRHSWIPLVRCLKPTDHRKRQNDYNYGKCCK